MVLKKRRNVREKGNMRDFKGDCSNLELKVVENEDICTDKSERVTQKEPQRMARNEVWGVGLL